MRADGVVREHVICSTLRQKVHRDTGLKKLQCCFFIEILILGFFRTLTTTHQFFWPATPTWTAQSQLHRSILQKMKGVSSEGALRAQLRASSAKSGSNPGSKQHTWSQAQVAEMFPLPSIFADLPKGKDLPTFPLPAAFCGRVMLPVELLPTGLARGPGSCCSNTLSQLRGMKSHVWL